MSLYRFSSTFHWHEGDHEYAPDTDEDKYQKWCAAWKEDWKDNVLPDFIQAGDLLTKKAIHKMSMTIPAVTVLVLNTPIRFVGTGGLLEPYSWRFSVLNIGLPSPEIQYAEFYIDEFYDYQVIRKGEVVFGVDKE